MANTQIKALFLDVGGVMLTNGWDRKVRSALADHFKLDLADFEARHHLTFDTYESGKISFDIFLNRTVFYKHRDFTHADFKKYVSDLTKPLPGMIRLCKEIKAKNNRTVAVVSNVGRDLTHHRVHKFGLQALV